MNGMDLFGRKIRIDMASRNGGGGRQQSFGGGGNAFGGRQQSGRNGAFNNGGGYQRSSFQGGNRGGFQQQQGGNAFGSGRGYGSYQDTPLPDEPPFVAFVGNLDFMVVQGDIDALFSGLQILDTRIVHDKETGQSKGYAYVEFATKQDLAQAVSFHGNVFMNRDLRINVADQSKRRQGGSQRGGNAFSGGAPAGGPRQQGQPPNRQGGPGGAPRGPGDHPGQAAFHNRKGSGSNRFPKRAGGPPNSRFDQDLAPTNAPPREQRTVNPGADIVEPSAEDEARRPRLQLKKVSQTIVENETGAARDPTVFGGAKPRDDAAVAKEQERAKKREAELKKEKEQKEKAKEADAE